MITDTRSDNIRLYRSFKTALLSLIEKDMALFSNRKNKASISHCLARYLENEIPYIKYLDLNYEIKLAGKDAYPDILLHDRMGNIQLAIFWKETYLSKSEQEDVKRFHEEAKAGLTLAFALLEDKPYILIYRFEENYVEYLHMDKASGVDEFLKQCDKEAEVNNEALLFKIPKRKRKKKVISSPEL